jgi:tight adherence protein B
LAVAVELLTAALRAGVPWDRAWTRAWTDPSTAAVSARVHATDVAVCAERVGWRQALEDWAAQQPWRAARELGVIAALVWRAGPAGLGALEHTAVRLRATVDLGGQLRADTAQIRASAWVMGALPLVGLCVLVLPSADARAFCLGTSLGRAALAAGAVLDAVGWWWLHSMLRRLERDVGLS